MIHNKQEDYLGNLEYILEKLDKTPQVTEAALNQLYTELNNPATTKKAKENRLNLPNSLIHNYYGFSITYIALEKTTECIQFTAGKIRDVVIYLSQKNIIKKVAVSAYDAITQEVNQTLEDTVNNPRERKKTA